MENWVSVFTTTEELEAGIVKDLLDEAGIPAVILNQKDSSYKTFGDINVMVNKENQEEAKKTLENGGWTYVSGRWQKNIGGYVRKLTLSDFHKFQSKLCCVFQVLNRNIFGHAVDFFHAGSNHHRTDPVGVKDIGIASASGGNDGYRKTQRITAVPK